MRTITRVALAAFLLFGLRGSTQARAQDSAPKTGELTVPWDEFKSLLDLGTDRVVVTLATFQKLLAQTGITTAPPHTLQGGNVILSKSEFENLVNQMQPPLTPTDHLPFEYLITRAVYAGTMRTGSTAFSARFTVHVLKKRAVVKVPILPAGTALQDLKVDGGPALLVTENGSHHVLLSETGVHEVVASFAVGSALEEGPHKIDLAIRPAPITLLTLEIPLKGIEVEIPQAQQVETSTLAAGTSVKAVIAQTSAVSIRWREKTAPTEKVPARLYAEVHHLVSIDDDALRVTTDLNLNILYSELDGIRLAMPEGIHVLTVTGEGVGERQEATQDGKPVIVIPFTYGRKGNVTVRVTSERPLTETGLGNIFTGMRVQSSVRETGYIGVVLNTSAEVLVAAKESIEEIAVPRLPQQLVNQSTKPLTLAFKYLKHPFSLTLDVKRHDKIAVPLATINSANIVTLVTEDGKVVHRLVYQVRNSAKQFLEISLPKEADVWSVFVGRSPVESSIGSEGKLLVPLNRSQNVGGNLETFPVEVIYCLVEGRFGLGGSRHSALPAVDLLISQLIWSVYLPNDYSYHYFESTLEKEEIIRGINLFSSSPRRYDERAMKDVGGLSDTDGLEDRLKRAYKGENYASDFRNAPMEESQFKSQVSAELEFSGRLDGLASQAVASPAGGGGTGILPIQIQVPTSGQVYRFAKTIVKPEDPLTVEVTYSRAWVAGSLKWIALLLIAWLVYLKRDSVGRLGTRLSKSWTRVAGSFKRREAGLAKAAQSALAPFVLVGLAALLWPLFPRLSLVVFFLLWVSVAYHAVNFVKKRNQTRAAKTVDSAAAK